MPLLKGKGKKTISKNIAMMRHEGKSENVAVAAAMHAADKKKKRRQKAMDQYGSMRMRQMHGR